MNPEAQRAAIAEACGWNHVHYAKDLSESSGIETFRGQPPGTRTYYDNVPDYPTDLNAMHEAEKVLTPLQMEEYVGFHLECAWRSDCAHHIRAATATAAQRAEAFLRTLNLWT